MHPVTLKIEIKEYEKDESLKDQMESNLKDIFKQMGYEIGHSSSNLISIKQKIQDDQTST